MGSHFFVMVGNWDALDTEYELVANIKDFMVKKSEVQFVSVLHKDNHFVFVVIEMNATGAQIKVTSFDGYKEECEQVTRLREKIFCFVKSCGCLKCEEITFVHKKYMEQTNVNCGFIVAVYMKEFSENSHQMLTQDETNWFGWTLTDQETRDWVLREFYHLRTAFLLLHPDVETERSPSPSRDPSVSSTSSSEPAPETDRSPSRDP